MKRSLVMLATAVWASTAWAGAETPDTRLLIVPLMAPQGLVSGELDSDDLTALLDEQPQHIQQISRPAVDSRAQGEPPPWEILIYFDAPLTTSDGLRKATLLLSHEAERLTRLGSTEIVLADPRPQIYLQDSRNPVAVRETLLDIRSESLTTGELQWHRQRFLETDRDEAASRADRAFRDEVGIIEQQRQSLLLWLAAKASAGPRLLILTQNGYDLNPRAFYSEQTAGSFLEDPRGGLSQAALSRTAAALGWTVLPLALGPRPREFAEPMAPLFEMARASGGEVITQRREMNKVLDRASTWPLVTIELTGGASRGPLPFEVLHGESGRQLKTTQWASAASVSSLVADLTLVTDIDQDRAGDADELRPVLRLLRPEGLTLEGRVRFRTISGRKRIHQVAFLLDGQQVAETERTPFTTIIDLGPAVRPCTVTAIAYSKSGRKLGEDSVQLNMGLEPPKVTITQLDYDSEQGALTVTATATSPSGSAPERVEVFLNDRQAEAFSAPPYTTQIDVQELRHTDFVRVVAHYRGGETAEAARLPAMTGPSDELEVNLVELLAMVTPRNRKSRVVLDRTDFVIRQQGQPLPIDQFSRWEELQLTLGLVLDTSDSMEEIIEDAQEAGERFFNAALRAGDEAFVVDFNDLPRLARHTTTDAEQLLHSLAGLEARGMTALYDAIVFSLQQFENTAGRRALVVVTDGEDSASYYQPRECVRQARLHGVPVYLIVLGTPPDPSREPSLLRNQMIARRTGGEVYYISDLDDLGRIYDQIVSELRRQYFLAFNTGHTLTPEELEEIEIEVVPSGIEVRTLLASQQRGG